MLNVSFRSIERQTPKRTGRAGWVVMWEAWFKLQDIIEGYKLAKGSTQGGTTNDQLTGE